MLVRKRRMLPDKQGVLHPHAMPSGCVQIFSSWAVYSSVQTGCTLQCKHAGQV